MGVGEGTEDESKTMKRGQDRVERGADRVGEQEEEGGQREEGRVRS